MRTVPLLAALPLIAAVTACTAGTPQAAPPPNVPSAATTPASATPTQTPTPTSPTKSSEEWAEAIKQDTTTKVVAITEDNDPNNLLGRPNGYTDAAVLYDKRVECAELGASCGAMIEIWASAADAQQRSEYIQTIQKAAPALGSEYHTLNGNALLRVTGELKPSEAKAYQIAFAN